MGPMGKNEICDSNKPKGGETYGKGVESIEPLKGDRAKLPPRASLPGEQMEADRFGQ